MTAEEKLNLLKEIKPINEALDQINNSMSQILKGLTTIVVQINGTN